MLRASGELRAESRIVREQVELAPPLLPVVRVYIARSIAPDFPQRGDVAQHERAPRAGCFDGGQAERLVARGMRINRRPLVPELKSGIVEVSECLKRGEFGGSTIRMGALTGDPYGPGDISCCGRRREYLNILRVIPQPPRRQDQLFFVMGRGRLQWTPVGNHASPRQRPVVRLESLKHCFAWRNHQIRGP